MKLYNNSAFTKTSLMKALAIAFCCGIGVSISSCGPEVSPITISVSENAMCIIDPPQSSIYWSDPALPVSWDLQQLEVMANEGWFFKTEGNDVLMYQVTKIVNVDDFN